MEDHLHNENPVPHVVLHEQEIATQKIIQAQSQREAAAGYTDGRDLSSERPDPSALKVEAKDSSSGASYYYNESIGKSQWE